MLNYTGIVIRKIQGKVCKEWKVQVENKPENAEYAGKIINTTSDIKGLGVGDRVTLRVFSYGNPKKPYLKLNIREKIEEC